MAVYYPEYMFLYPMETPVAAPGLIGYSGGYCSPRALRGLRIGLPVLYGLFQISHLQASHFWTLGQNCNEYIYIF